MNFNNLFLASTLGNDPHTEGIHNAIKIAKLGGINGFCLSPSSDLKNISDAIKKYNPRFIGLSYRLTPEIGVKLLIQAIQYFASSSLIRKEDPVKISFAGLPETIRLLTPLLKELPLEIHLVQPQPDVMARAIDTVNFFEINYNRTSIINKLREELVPEGIHILDEIADEVIANDDYKNEPPLKIPSPEAINSFIKRINESAIPLLRSHFGIPDTSIDPTVAGIRKLATTKVIDELSLGSSDLSQRYFGNPEMFKSKNDGGVPYKDEADLEKLYNATLCGNYPAIKPYCHVVNIVPFINTCLKIGLLKGGHQAIPLYWFNEIDGRGPHTMEESIIEHFAGVKELVRHGIPVEMNDPNQWSSRNAHDTIIVASYALISAVMTMCGVQDMIVQMQFNKPKETGDYADLAKMRAAKHIMTTIASYKPNLPRIHIESRTGIESLSSDMNKAKWQLGRSTLLQMCMNPDIIHIVSYCEANYAAKPEDIIDSSRLIRRAIRLFNENKYDILKETQNDIITDRELYLYNEATFLMNKITDTETKNLRELTPRLGTPYYILKAINNGIMSAPGIINPKFKGNFTTKPMKYGMINLVDEYINPIILTEKDRLENKL